MINDQANDGHDNGTMGPVSGHHPHISSPRTYMIPSPKTPVTAILRRTGR